MTGELNHRDEFESILQGAMAEETAQADTRVWENIEAALTEEKKRRGVIWWTWGLAAGIALLAGLFLVQNQLSPGDMMVQESHGIQHEDGAPIESGVPSMHPRGDEQKDNTDGSSRENKVDNNVEATASKDSAQKKHKQDWSGTVKVRATDTPVPMSFIGARPSISLNDAALVEMNRSDVGIDEILDDPTTQPQGWNLGGNVQSGNSATESAYLATETLDASFSGPTLASAPEAVATEPRVHHVPMSIGFMAGYQLNKRLTLNTGLNYTRLVSTWGQADVAHKLQSHYIGVPAILNWEFIQSKKFNMYSSTGLLFEHGVASTKSTTMEINGAKSIQKYQEPTPGFQGGVMVGFGMEYTVSKNIGLYLQPAVTSWLVNVNQPASIRTTQTFAPTLQLGARFQLKK